MQSRSFSLIITWLIALATSASAQTTPTLLFKDDFNAANGTSLTDPATRATGTLASTVKYEWTGTTNLTTQDVVVDGTLNWDSNGDRNGQHQQPTDTSAQRLRMTYNWAPQVNGRVWEVEFDQRVGWSSPLTFGLSDNVQNGIWDAWNNANYDFAAGSYGTSLFYDTDNDGGGTGHTNPTSVAAVFPALVATNPPSNQIHHFRIRFDEPNGTATVWINGVQKAQVTSLDFENAGRYLSWGEPTSYAGALDNITISVFETPPTIVSYNPAQAATGVYPAAPLVATFSNAITLTGAGSITIQDMAGANDVAINVTDPAQVSVSGTNLIITPPARLAYGNPFKVVIGPGTVVNFSTEPMAAQWTFTTAAQEFTAPVITLKNPVDGGFKVAPSANLTTTFDQNITAGSGNIIIVDTDNNTTTRTIAVTDAAQVSFAGKVLTIDPTAPLTLGKHYAVQIAAGAIKNYSDIPFAGIPNSDVTTWNFAIIDPLKIMPMGDSITVGGTNAGNVEPYWYGYRSVLYNLLHGAGYNFLFVGQSTQPPSPLPVGTIPPADLAALGQNAHNGLGGSNVTYLNTNILTWLAADDPDVILLKIGTNGWDTAGLNTLVNTITTTKPDVRLIIAQIIPKYTYDVGVVNYNTYIRNTLVPYYQGLGKKVTLVDQYAQFLTNPGDLTSIDQSLFSNGINHPTNVGYAKMAQVWFNGIKALGIGPEFFANWISDGDFQIAPGDQGLHSDPDGDGIPNGVEYYFGTDPGKFSQGLVPVTADVGAGTFTFIFTHPLNPAGAGNLTAAYRWSRDLSTFTAGGVWSNGSTVNFTQSAPSGGFVTVTATVTGAPLDKLFVDVRVTQN
jgi:methionine-rich copper-binding protein CopC